jgi:hypothetical protein
MIGTEWTEISLSQFYTMLLTTTKKVYWGIIPRYNTSSEFEQGILVLNCYTSLGYVVT